MFKNRVYNNRQPLLWSVPVVSKQKSIDITNFGVRLAFLRKAAGYTQNELASELGVTRRMIAYYEGETEHPPTTLLPNLTRALGVTTDQLLGIITINRIPKSDTRLQRRLQQIEKLNPKDKRQIMQLLDAFIERGQLKRKVKAS